MIFLTKRKFLKLSSKNKKINLRISCQELHTTWKESLNIQRKNKLLKSLLKSKILKRTTHHKSFFWKIKFLNLRQLTPTEILNLKPNFNKIKISKLDIKMNLEIYKTKTIFWEKEYWSSNRWTKLKLKIFNKNTATFMSKEQQAWKSNIKDKSDFF